MWKWLTLFKRVSRGGCKHIHREAHSIHFPHLLFFPHSYSICFVLQWVFQKLLSSLCTSLSSPLLRVCFTCAAVTTMTPSPPSFSPSLSSQSRVHLIHLMSPPPIVLAHSRQRQNSVGMNTPNATRMGNIRLLLSAAYGFGVRGPDWTL